MCNEWLSNDQLHGFLCNKGEVVTLLNRLVAKTLCKMGEGAVELRTRGRPFALLGSNALCVIKKLISL